MNKRSNVVLNILKIGILYNWLRWVIEARLTLLPGIATTMNKIHPSTVFKTLDVKQQKIVISNCWETNNCFCRVSPTKASCLESFQAPVYGRRIQAQESNGLPKRRRSPSDSLGIRTLRVFRTDYWRWESYGESEHQIFTEGPLKYSAEEFMWGSYPVGKVSPPPN